MAFLRRDYTTVIPFLLVVGALFTTRLAIDRVRVGWLCLCRSSPGSWHEGRDAGTFAQRAGARHRQATRAHRVRGSRGDG